MRTELDLSNITIKRGQADRHIEMTFETRDTGVILNMIQTITNLHIPQVREILLEGGGRQNILAFCIALLADINSHMHNDLFWWEGIVPLVLASEAGDYSHVVKLSSSFPKPPKSEMEITLTTHAMTDPIAANWLTSFKGSLSQPITQRTNRS